MFARDRILRESYLGGGQLSVDGGDAEDEEQVREITQSGEILQLEFRQVSLCNGVEIN